MLGSDAETRLTQRLAAELLPPHSFGAYAPGGHLLPFAELRRGEGKGLKRVRSGWCSVILVGSDDWLGEL